VLGVVYTQRAAIAREGRDRQERADERRADLQQEVARAQQEVEERRAAALFDRRVEAHEVFLLAADRARDSLLESLWADAERRTGIIQESSEPLYHALTQLRMFAGSDSARAAEELYQSVRDVGTSSDRQAVWQRFQEAITSYRFAMRADLGHK